MSPDELVSVVVPSFDHAAHLEEALRSVAAQDGVALELVVVDDASSDDSVAVVERLFADPGFAARFAGGTQLAVQPVNRGAHAALNRGLELARGGWLAILNSDDAYAPGRLAALREALVATGSALAFSRVAFVDADSRPSGPSSESWRLRRHQDVIDRAPSVGFACLTGNAALTTGNLFFTRALLDAVGPFAPLRYCHDWDFLLRAVLHSEPVFVRGPLYRYRLHEANSFRALEPLAEAETDAVLRGYFGALRAGAAANERAPAPWAWPGVFERTLSRHGFWRYW